VRIKSLSFKILLSCSAAIVVFLGLYLSSLYHYLLFHSIAEFFSIIIATTIFLVAWNARRFFDNNYFIFIGVSYLFVAGLDLIHTLAYKGIGIFIGYDANLPTQLWIATRYVQSLSLLIAPLFLLKTLRLGSLFIVYSLVSCIILASLFVWKIFPDCFIEGSGLTKFKTTSEYIIAFILLVSGFNVFRYRIYFDQHVLNRVLLSIGFFIISELTFTFYAAVYDFANLVGHYFKILAFYLLYEAIVATGFSQPYKLLLRNLKHSEEKLHSVVQTAADAIITINSQGEIILWNRSAENIFGYSAEEINNHSATALIPERMREAHLKGLNRVLATGKSTLIGKTIETIGLNKDGLEFPIELSLATWQTLREFYFTAIIRDITERKKTDEALVRAHADLESKVDLRTAELLLQNERLRIEIEGRINADNALRQSETKYRIVADNTYDWEWWLNPERKFIYISPSCHRITGYTPAEFISEPQLINRIIFPDDRDKFRLHVDEVDRERKGGEVEFRIVRNDGSIRWISHLCQPVYDEHGNFLGHRGSNRDSTARKLVENALFESEKTLRILSEQLLAVQENERKRIALEVHDGINQTLAAIKFALEKKLTQMNPAKAPEGLSLEGIIELVQSGIEESRRIQMDLRPSILDDLGIIATLRWFIREFQKIYTHIEIDFKITLEENNVPEGIKIVIFRIVQEAFNNIFKHSEADLAHLSLKRTNDGIELIISDNGVGFDPENVQKGLGLTSMSERARFSGGQFFLESTPGTQTIINVTWSGS
jgi:PAS domain S-box-containing protein